MKKNKPLRLTCPCCGKARDAYNTMLPDYYRYAVGESKDHPFEQWVKRLGGASPEAAQQNPDLRPCIWACKACIKDGRVSLPDYKKQNSGLTGGLMVYVSLRLNCTHCGKDFVFGTSKQKHWYEVLRFNTRSYPKQCTACRKKIRYARNNNTRLGRLLAIKKPGLDELEAIGHIYLEMGKIEKAALFRKKADRLRAAGLTTTGNEKNSR